MGIILFFVKVLLRSVKNIIAAVMYKEYIVFFAYRGQIPYAFRIDFEGDDGFFFRLVSTEIIGCAVSTTSG